MSWYRDLVRRSNEESSPLYVGVDPGATGAVGFVVGKLAFAISIPTTKVKVGKGFQTQPTLKDIVELFDGVREDFTERFACVEQAQVRVAGFQVKNKFGKNRTAGVGGMWSAFRTGVNFGMWPLFLTQVFGTPPTILIPRTWKKAMGLTASKDRSRRIAAKLFPDLDVTLKKDHDRAEAVLMAEYLRRTHNG